MQGKMTLGIGTLMLTVASHAIAWDVGCKYGSFDQDTRYCEVTQREASDNSGFGIGYRSGEDEYDFFYKTTSNSIEFSEGAPVRFRLDDREVQELGSTDNVYNYDGGASYSPLHTFEVSLPVSEAERILSELRNSDVLRLKVEQGSEFYAEIPLTGFEDAVRSLQENTE
ncbi:hypothetical protein QWY79_14065 [Halomonas sabkhae]|uniref:hypothetical protein n=1 Tax=Halomonas sabkhae TaxID=626223 RepID=UPI0025B5E996|nr:hypothetical protein [Halomonas sabkhae]MDN3526393.1 hypothetical protein [Halomonas sabkhae]